MRFVQYHGWPGFVNIGNYILCLFYSMRFVQYHGWPGFVNIVNYILCLFYSMRFVQYHGWPGFVNIGNYILCLFYSIVSYSIMVGLALLRLIITYYACFTASFRTVSWLAWVC